MKKNKINPAESLSYSQKYYLKNKEKYAQRTKKYYQENREDLIKRNSKNQKENREELNKQRREKYKTDIQYRLRRLIRGRMRLAIVDQKGTKQASALDLLGCSIDEVRAHIESLFVEGMSWDNHGEWHIDHIIPCASFDMTDLEQQKKCFHYTNLQPLWAFDNLSKGDR